MLCPGGRSGQKVPGTDKTVEKVTVGIHAHLAWSSRQHSPHRTWLEIEEQDLPLGLEPDQKGHSSFALQEAPHIGCA